MMPRTFHPHLELLAIATALVLTVMVLTWQLGRSIRNYGIVDAVWSFLFAPVAAIYAFIGDGDLTRRVILVLMVSFWSVRLGAHLTRRIAHEHPREDPRYGALRREWASRVNSRMLGFYLLQGILVVVLAVPFLIPVFNKQPSPHALELLGVALFFAGLIGESVSDAQLSRFKRQAAGPDSVCEIGLWHYSRHPNYFFEWLVWVGFATFSLPSEHGWLGLIAPLLMLHFLLNVTGIPLTEELAVVRKGDAYRRYQQTTSRFVPWPRKET